MDDTGQGFVPIEREYYDAPKRCKRTGKHAVGGGLIVSPGVRMCSKGA